jgi:ankyrin repeat protein
MVDRAQVSKLQWAVRNQDLSSMRQLLSSDKMLMNAVDYDQRTPLHVAALFDCRSAARILLMQVRVVSFQKAITRNMLCTLTGSHRHSALLHTMCCAT